MISFIYLAIRLSRLKNLHMTSDLFPRGPIHYVHSPETGELESGMRMRKVAGERQLDIPKSSNKVQRSHSHISRAWRPYTSFPTSPTPGYTCQLPPCLRPPAVISSGTYPNFLGKSSLTSQTTLFFKLKKNNWTQNVKSIKPTELTNGNILSFLLQILFC